MLRTFTEFKIVKEELSLFPHRKFGQFELISTDFHMQSFQSYNRAIWGVMIEYYWLVQEF